VCISEEYPRDCLKIWHGKFQFFSIVFGQRIGVGETAGVKIAQLEKRGGLLPD
jgi:hypothetical protein